MELRDYQDLAITEIRSEYRKGSRSVIVCLPTGGGKTPLVAWGIIKPAVTKGNKVLFLAHTQELIDQGASHIARTGVGVGIIMAGRKPQPQQPVQVASIQTLARRELPEAQVVIVDECHHVRAATYAKVIAHYRNAGALVIGLTATPERLDGKGLGEFFQTIIEPTTVRELIDREYLAPYRYFAPHVPGLDGIKKIGGDYSKKGLTGAMNKPSITGDIVSHYLKMLAGQQAMVFACGIKHSMALIEAFTAAGVSAAHLDGKTPKAERSETIRRFRAGEINVISNVGLFGEGVDVPNLAGVIIARPTASMTWHRQAIGRSLRYVENKTAIILDHSGNWTRHGMPDEIVEWRLEDKETKKSDAPKHKYCPICFAVLKLHVKQCDQCGHIFRSKPRTGPEIKGGELEEVSQRKWTKEAKRELYASLLEVARLKGYMVGWCKRRYKRETYVWPRGMKDLEKASFAKCGHVREDATTERCRYCGEFLGRDY